MFTSSLEPQFSGVLENTFPLDQGFNGVFRISIQKFLADLHELSGSPPAAYVSDPG